MLIPLAQEVGDLRPRVTGSIQGADLGARGRVVLGDDGLHLVMQGIHVLLPGAGAVVGFGLHGVGFGSHGIAPLYVSTVSCVTVSVAPEWG